MLKVLIMKIHTNKAHEQSGCKCMTTKEVQQKKPLHKICYMK